MDSKTELIIDQGEADAKAGQYALLVLGATFMIDILVTSLGFMNPWLGLILFSIEFISIFASVFFLLGTIGNIFMLSRHAAYHNNQLLGAA